MILHQCTKNHDHMLFSCRAMAWTDYVGPFLSFYPLGSLKIKIAKIKKKHKRDTMILHQCNKN